MVSERRWRDEIMGFVLLGHGQKSSYHVMWSSLHADIDRVVRTDEQGVGTRVAVCI